MNIDKYQNPKSAPGKNNNNLILLCLRIEAQRFLFREQLFVKNNSELGQIVMQNKKHVTVLTNHML